MLPLLISMLLPLAVNKSKNIDNRVFSLDRIAFDSAHTESFFAGFENYRHQKFDEIVIAQAAPVRKKVVYNQRPISKKAVEPLANAEKISFKKFKSSFREIEKYWPTKALNPINKKEVKLKTVTKIDLPKPTNVKKAKFNPAQFIKDDFDFSVASASKDDVIKLAEMSDNGTKENREISLLSLSIQNHIKANGNVYYTMPTLAATKFNVNSLSKRIADIEEHEVNLKEEDKLIELAVTELKQDKVKLKQAAVVKKNSNTEVNTHIDEIIAEIQEPKKLDKNKQKDEMVFLDYTKPQASPTKDEIISESVRNVISREMAKIGKNKNVLLASADKPKRRSVNPNVKALADFIAAKPKPNNKAESLDFSPNQIIVRPLIYDLKQGTSSNLYEFDFMPSYDLNDVLPDAGNGYVKVDYSLNSGFGLLHGSIVHRDTVRLNVDIPVGHEVNDYSFPIFGLDQFNTFLQENDLSVPGGYLLVEYSEGIDSIDIEKYEKVLNLDSKFRPVKEGQPFDYSLFVGVVAGNNLLRALTNDGKITEKIIFVYDDELTFTATDFGRSEKIKIELTEESLLGKASRLSVDSEHLKYFNLPIKSERTTLNSYNVDAPPLLNGMRRYLEVISDGQLFVVGTQKNGKLRVPSQDTLNLYLDRVNLTDFENSCIVQINTNEPIEEVRIEGVTPRGPMLLDTHYLNDRGRLYKSIDGVVKKVFVTGDYQGTIYFNITYLNGKREVSRSYCSPGTYVIENF